jgi:uncharacterized protein (TIGR02001 family)
MPGHVKTFCAAALCGALAAGPAPAENLWRQGWSRCGLEAEDAPELSLGADLASQYVSRGVRINADPVIQPSAELCWRGLRAGVWASVDTTDYSDREWDVQELNLELGYEKAVGPVTLAAGHIWYKFPGTEPDTAEVYAGVSWERECWPELSVTVYYDYAEAKGFYVAPAAEYTWSLIEERLALTATVSTGWGDAGFNRYNMGVERAGLTDLTAELALSWQVTEALSVGPFIAVTEVLDPKLRSAINDESGEHSAHLWGGLRLAATF